jgi:uncharacterized protein (AIM24 family)
LCAAKGIEIEVAFTKCIGAGLFGGEEFILQRLKGEVWHLSMPEVQSLKKSFKLERFCVWIQVVL